MHARHRITSRSHVPETSICGRIGHHDGTSTAEPDRTLAKFEAAGFITMKTVGRRKAPSAALKKIVVEIDPYSDRDRIGPSVRGHATADRTQPSDSFCGGGLVGGLGTARAPSWQASERYDAGRSLRVRSR